MSRIDEAFQSVNHDEFVLREDGSVVIQNTSSQAIKESLELLDVQEGDRVLEIGTGSGFSTALLSHLVGSEGSVVSIDIEPEMTTRAKGLFEQKGITNVRFVTKDGRTGDIKNSPYDRIIAWTTSDYLPLPWVDQLKEQGILVAPFLVGGIANSMFVCQMKKEDGKLVGQRIISGDYILMNDTPEYESYGQELAADVKEMDGSEAVAWVSTKWVRGRPKEVGRNLLKQIVQQMPQKLDLKMSYEEEQGFRAYLFSKEKDGLTTALCHETIFIGYSNIEEGFALIDPQESLIVSNSEAARQVLESWLDEWRKLGKPSIENFVPIVMRRGRATVGLKRL